MNEVQDKILCVFQEFKRICDEYCLRYYAIGGTCIGAIRHNGFIPWDDDLDVAMPAEDYFKFQTLAQKELSLNYEIMGPFTCRHYNSSFIKLQDKNTTFIEAFTYPYPDRYGGVYIDIFPIFGLPQNGIKRKIVEYKCSLYNALNKRIRFPFPGEESIKSKIIWFICYPLRLFHDYDYYTKKLYNDLKKFDFEESDKVIFCWRDLPWRNKRSSYKNIFFLEDFEAGIEVQFESDKMCIPKGYDRYLKMDFGNYMELPPEEMRKEGHPKAIVDLSRPYSLFKEGEGAG